MAPMKMSQIIEGVQSIDFKVNGDNRGSLVAIESLHNIPFEIKRIYYIYATMPEISRGCHAHPHLQQVLVCVNGSCDIYLFNGKEEKWVHLDQPNTGIYISGFVWREMHNFSRDCVLLAIVDEYYEDTVYVYDKNYCVIHYTCGDKGENGI